MRTFNPFEVVKELRVRSVEAILGQSGLNHRGLAAEIRRRFAGSDMQAGALLQEPVVEAAFPFIEADGLVGDLAGGLLHAKVVDALDAPGEPRICRDWYPYRHQLEAWTLLTDPTPQSVLVSSGTGSGKTECFMVPLLDDLAREVDRSGRLTGVRAIALYPLNALIASQQERLRKWTAPFGGNIRFGLYNGEMPEDDRDAVERSQPEQVASRRTLRADPPPILVTNVTMLEYLTVRRQDRKLLDASQGALRWIILDEAHSYTGSRAAEIALLLRRVMLAFGVTPDQVRFVATSATIGEGKDVTDALRRFLADVSGAPEGRVHVVEGKRRRPALPSASQDKSLGRADLTAMSAAERFTVLAGNPAFRTLNDELWKRPLSWPEITGLLGPTGYDPEAVVLAAAGATDGRDRLLPIRVHLFHRAVPGLWTCLDPKCHGKAPDWPFGALAMSPLDTCPSCDGAAVLPIILCRGCGEPFVEAHEVDGRLQAPDKLADDEFALDSEEERADAPDPEIAPASAPAGLDHLLATRQLPEAVRLNVEPRSGRVFDIASPETVPVHAHPRLSSDVCPACQERATPTKPEVLRPFRFGAPSILTNASPILVATAEPAAPEPGQIAPPAGGRQLLSFTDSRQGTARFSAKVQSAAERNFLRSLIYFGVQDTLKGTGSAAEIEQFEAQIKLLSASSPPLIIEALQNEIAKRKATGLEWNDLRDSVAATDTVAVWIKDVWAKRDRPAQPHFSDELSGAGRLAEFLLLRELARRTTRANSVETMGLAALRFPRIERLPDAKLPSAFRQRGRTIADWCDFLHLCLTFVARTYFAIRISDVDAHWIQPSVPVKSIAPPGTETGRRQISWPKVLPNRIESRGTLPRLLEIGLGLDPHDRGDLESINELLEIAWRELRPLFERPGSTGDARLDLGEARVVPVTRAWRCPITRRVLDTVFCGLSPFGLRTGVARGVGAQGEPIELPVHPAPFLRSAGDEAAVADWLATDAKVEALRAIGLWTNLHDRIALGSPYLRSAEHSAQQPPRRLRAYEAKFKRGEINILNCSTTMEMGVDIGSVSTVMMTNVPPSIANYRQRVGRAGRRRQATALAMTYCRDVPLEREAFREPAKFLARSVAAPRVTLDSQPLVQRHVNALLLASFVRRQDGDMSTAKAGDFYGYPADLRTERLPNPPSDAFRAWVVQPSTKAEHQAAVERLVRGSVLQGHRELLEAAAEAVATAEASYRAEWSGLLSQVAGLDRATAKKAIEFQLRRLHGEFLLSDLADRSVLPGHGFPTDVVQFIHKDGPDGDEPSGSDVNDGNPFRRRNFPSRNLDQALRDYAPGAEVVVDGLVYRSAGVTLNWQRPASASAAREIQSLKHYWKCKACGAADTAYGPVDACPECGAGSLARGEFLRPGGFAADPREAPHADADVVSYIPTEPAAVATRGAPWRPLRVPSLGRIRASRGNGLVFYANAGGELGFGFQLCLHCGRAEREGLPGRDPDNFLSHRPMRFTKGDADGICPGAGRPFAIKRHLTLGHDINTDVVEIDLAALTDEGVAWALASALRTALAGRLGVEISEMGILVAPRDTPLGGHNYAILMFDHAANGAGFAPSALAHMPQMVIDARRVLDCPVPGCVKGCSACVLTPDLHDNAERLDRRGALAFVDERMMLLAQPEAEDIFAPGARYSDNIADEIAASASGGQVFIWDERPDIGSVQRSTFIDLAEHIRSSGRRLSLILPQRGWEAMDEATRLGMRDFAIRYDIEFRTGAAPTFANGAIAIAAANIGGSHSVWATRAPEARELGESWGLPQHDPIVRADAVEISTGETLDLGALRPRPSAVVVQFTTEADGPSMNFGERFVGLVTAPLRRVGGWRAGHLTGIKYYDRYVRSPYAVHLVLHALASLAKHLGQPGVRVPVELVTAPVRQDEPERWVSQAVHDWQDDEIRAQVTSAFATRLDLKPTVIMRQDRHARQIDLHYDDGAVITLLLDQGFGCWRPPKGIRLPFDFAASVPKQAGALAGLNCMIAGPSEPSYIVITQAEHAVSMS